ncbi:unnamed protein product [Mucor hiemalis]
MYVQQLEAKASELKEVCEKQKSDLSAGKAKEKQKQELIKKNNEIKSLESKLNEAYTQVKQANQQVEELKSQNESLQEEVNKLDEENMVLKIEKDMDSLDEDDDKMEEVEKTDNTEEMTALRKELEESRETSSALIAAEKERTLKLDSLTKELKKYSARNIELERAELKYQRELEEYQNKAHKPESTNTATKMNILEEHNKRLQRDINNYKLKIQELKDKAPTNNDPSFEHEINKQLLNARHDNDAVATTAKITNLEEHNKRLQRDISNYKSKIQELKGKAPANNDTSSEHEVNQQLLIARYDNDLTAATTKISNLEENNRRLQRDNSNYKSKLQELKGKSNSPTNNAMLAENKRLRDLLDARSTATSPKLKKSPKSVSPVTLKVMHKLKADLIKARFEKQLMMDYILNQSLLKDKTIDELLSSSAESGDERAYPPWETTDPPLLFTLPPPFSPVASRKSSDSFSANSSSSSSRKSSDGSVISVNQQQDNSITMMYTTSASPSLKNAASSAKNLLSPTAKRSPESPVRSTSVPNSKIKSTSPTLTPRGNNYGSSGLVAPPSALSLTKPKKRVANSRLVRFANSKNPGKFISGGALPAPMTPSELINTTDKEVTIVPRATKRVLEEDGENQSPQASESSTTQRTIASPVRRLSNDSNIDSAAVPTAASPTSVSPTAAPSTFASPTGASPTIATATATSSTATSSTTTSSTATSSTTTSPTTAKATTATSVKKDAPTTKKRKVEASLLRTIEESLQTCNLINLDEIILKDIDKAFIELIESFSGMKSGISPEAAPDISFGIKNKFTIQVPNNFFKGEKEYAWYLCYLSTKEPFYNHIMSTVIEKIKFDIKCTKREGVIARWMRLAAIITRSRNDCEKMVSIMSDIAGTPAGKRFFFVCLINVTRAFPSCFTPTDTMPNLPRTLQVALAHIGTHTGSENAMATYSKLAPVLDWPVVTEVIPLRSLAEENLASIPDVGNLKTEDEAGNVFFTYNVSYKLLSLFIFYSVYQSKK